MALSPQAQRLQRRLEAIPAQVKRDVEPALIKSAAEMTKMMRQLAPVDEGDLRDSIMITPPGQSTPAYSQPGGERIAGETEAMITVGNIDVRYPHLQEYGTSEHPAQPFFWPSVRLLRKRAASRIKRAIGKSIRNYTAGGK